MLVVSHESPIEHMLYLGIEGVLNLKSSISKTWNSSFLNNVKDM